MPKAKANPRFTAAWWANRFQLSPTDRDTLIELAGLNPKWPEQRGQADQLAQQVEGLLGQVTGMKAALDGTPRPASLLAEVEPFQDSLETTCVAISELSTAVRRAIGRRRLRQLKVLTETILGRSESMRRRLEVKESRRAPTRKTERELVYRLALIYLQFIPPEEQTITGDMREFIETAMRAIDMATPDRKLFDQRCRTAMTAYRAGMPAY